ncbi:MAG: DUF3467 domain-containing protein [Betaproteobacteria bacterium]|nr:DUF3467 domain-containing protein [Betaproteobacteria bacterium]
MPEEKQQSSESRRNRPKAARGAPERRMRLDTSKLTTAFCNFFTAQDGPEEVVLNFGLRQRWDPNEQDVTVQMLQQVILHPAGVRRLRDLLDQLIAEREARATRAKGG